MNGPVRLRNLATNSYLTMVDGQLGVVATEVALHLAYNSQAQPRNSQGHGQVRLGYQTGSGWLSQGVESARCGRQSKPGP